MNFGCSESITIVFFCQSQSEIASQFINDHISLRPMKFATRKEESIKKKKQLGIYGTAVINSILYTQVG